MNFNEVVIAFLLGIVTNILTFLVTKHYTSERDRTVFKQEERESRGNIADAAVGHLRSSYLAVKKLELSVLDQQRKLENDRFNLVIWGIAQSLDQIRLGLQGHMNVWKAELAAGSNTLRDVEQFISEDVIIRSSTGRESSPAQKDDIPLPSVSNKKEVGFNGLRDLLRSPSERLMSQIMSGDFEGMEDALKQVVARKGPIDEIVARGGLLALKGSESAVSALLKVLTEQYEVMDSSAKQAALTASAQGYNRAGKSSEGALLIEPIAEKMLKDERLQEKAKAHVCNQVGMLLSSADEFARAVSWEEKATRLDPEEPAYACNLAISYAHLSDTARARELFERSLSLGQQRDPHHLFAALKFFHDQKDEHRVAELVPLLEKADPVKAGMFRLLRENERRAD